MKNDYCIIKVYAATNNEYVVKDNLTFDEAQEAFEQYNSTPTSSDEHCMYIIGEGTGEIDYIADASILDDDDDDDDSFDLGLELDTLAWSKDDE